MLKLIFQLLHERSKYLVLDSTTWRIGKKKIHLLTLCIIYRNIAIPIYWHQLNKKGHSSEKERETLIQEALLLYNLKGKILLADRDGVARRYIGEKWLAFLSESGINFVIRMSETCYKIPISQATGFSYSKLQKQALKRKRGVIKSFLLNGCLLSVVLLKNPKLDPQESILYFVSSLTNKVHITEAYRIRWKIENCFKHLKTNGFNCQFSELMRKNTEICTIFYQRGCEFYQSWCEQFGFLSKLMQIVWHFNFDLWVLPTFIYAYFSL